MRLSAHFFPAAAVQTAAMLPLIAAVLYGDLPIWAAAALGMLHAAGYFAVMSETASLVRRLGLAAAIGAAGIACATANWLLAAWFAFLIGLRMSQLLGATANSTKFWIIADLLLLLLLLFFGMIPRLMQAAGGVPANLEWFVAACWTATLALAALSSHSGRLPPVEHIAAVLFFLLTLVLALSAALLAALHILPYGPAVLLTVVIGQSAVAMFWLAWSPLLGSGLSTVFFRHVLALGVPVDEWLTQMEEIASSKASAAAFWQSSLERLQERMRLRGLRWSDSEGKTLELGTAEGHHVDLPLRGGSLRAYAERRWLPSAIFNLWMLARVASEFRQAKLREERRAAETAVRSVHEIGAKTTHDIKNILHVIRLMSGRPESNSPERMQHLEKLAGRLEEALKSLGSAAARAATGTTIAAGIWWQGVQERYRDLGIDFETAAADFSDREIPAELFDRTLENMVHNAIRKRRTGKPLQVRVRLAAGPALEVADNGDAVEGHIVERLFAMPVPSSDGMGIGLFQLAAAAARTGWNLRLARNRQGDVRFRLEPEEPQSRDKEAGKTA